MGLRRKVRWLALILAILAGGGGYWLTHDEGPNPVLRQIQTGILPGLLAADRHARHLFVVDFNSDLGSGQPVRSYPDGWWPQFQRRLKGLAGWLPFSPPPDPPPPGTVSVKMLDLSKL